MGNLIKTNNLKASFKEMKWYEWLMAIVMVGIAGWSMIKAFMSGEANGNPAWLTVINFISAVCGVICIFFCAKANISNYAFGLVNTLVYAVYLIYWHIWGTAMLELLFYLPMNIISWIVWVKHRDNGLPQKTKSKKLNWWQNTIVAVIVVGFAVAYHAVLAKLNGNVVWLDAFTLSIGIMATILQMLRYREQYVWWLITDVIAVAMYIMHFDPVYLTKKSIYLIMAIIGLMNWWKLQKERNTENA